MTEGIEKEGFVYEFDGFVVDPKDKTVLIDGRSMHLPAKEFETLVLLIEHNGRALTKEEMLSSIWQGTFVEESNLATYISRLRKIFNANGNKLIETLPKHGYRFSADLRKTVRTFEEPVIIEKRTVKRLTLEVGGEGDEPRKALPPGKKKFLTSPRVAAIGGIVLATLGILYWRQLTMASLPKVNSIAALPLKALSNDENNKALGLGLTDALITKLGGVKSIIVRPTSSVARFADTGEDSLEIGKKLNVDAVLEGTIQQSGGRIRINARLLRTSTGEQIWADRFDSPSSEIFALQDELSAKMAKALAFELTNADNASMARRGTENTEAYEKYLRGRFYQSQNTADGLKQSIELYQQAVALDPSFADAQAGIADANILQFNFGMLPAAETIPQAREAVAKALQLNPDLSSAYTSKALIQFLIDHNWPEAEKSLVRAIELNPNNADAFVRYGYFLINVGRFDEAIQKLEKARELNPLSPIINADVGLAHLSARRYPQAINELEKTAAENPQFTLANWLLGAAYEAAGDNEKGFQANLKALRTEGAEELVQVLQKARDEQGVFAANQRWFQETLTNQKAQRIPALVVASRAASVNDGEQTLIWLEKAYQEDDPAISQIKYLPKYDFVRGDPRFQAIASKIGY